MNKEMQKKRLQVMQTKYAANVLEFKAFKKHIHV